MGGTSGSGGLRGAVIGVGAAGVAAIGVFALSAAIGTAFARMVVTPARKAHEPVTVTRVEQRDGDTVVWLRGEDVSLAGKYSLLFDGTEGHARLGDVVAIRGGDVARTVLTVDRGSLREGARGRITGWWYTSPEELGFRTERTVYETELGEAEAWIVRPRRIRKKRWAIHVHGRGARPEEVLRGVAPLVRAGIACMVISYRNDAGAPEGENGRYGIGVAEQRDVDAAIADALRRGAERVTLMGWSMGGTACLLAAASGPHSKVIDGVILDSPAVDWPGLLRHQAGLKNLPGPLAALGMGLLRRGAVRGGVQGGIPLDSLTPGVFAAALDVPVLIHASEQDSFVPREGAERLAGLRPDLVQLRLSKRGEHVKIWNADPEPWEAATQHFAASLPTPAWRG